MRSWSRVIASTIAVLAFVPAAAQQPSSRDAGRERMRARMEIIQTLQRSRPEVVHLFDQLVRTLPDGVFLTSVKQNEKRLELKGMAQSSTRVSAFMRNIDASDWMDNPELEVVETKKDSALGSEFTLYANQVGVTLPGEEEVAQP